MYLVVATDYCTKWVEAKALPTKEAVRVARFLYENIITRFGCPLEFVSDQGAEFLNQVIHELMQKHMIVHKKSTVYYPQANGQAESTNKILPGHSEKDCCTASAGLGDDATFCFVGVSDDLQTSNGVYSFSAGIRH